jgi:hypothetical protein
MSAREHNLHAHSSVTWRHEIMGYCHAWSAWRESIKWNAIANCTVSAIWQVIDIFYINVVFRYGFTRKCIHKLDFCIFLSLAGCQMVDIESNDVGHESAHEEAIICHKAHITSHSSRSPPFWLKSAWTLGNKEMSDSPTHKWQKDC